MNANDNGEHSSILALSDEALFEKICSLWTNRVPGLANPYSNDGSYAAAISSLPIGLRSMAATHHLDLSLTLDDIGWHFLNFGELSFVRETESGLRELGLQDVADWFRESHEIVAPLRAEINEIGDYYECLRNHGQLSRIEELTQLARGKDTGSGPEALRSCIYSAWVKYARQSPERVFDC